MFYCVLYLLVFTTSLNASEEAFLGKTASSAAQLKTVALAKLSKPKCAHQCFLEGLACDGFQLVNTSSDVTCMLYSKICFSSNSSQLYYEKNGESAGNNTGGNLALGKPANMSSLYNVANNASHGNDGIKPTSDSGLFHTMCGDQPPWWRVDLIATECVTHVYFMNRGYTPDGVWQRAKNIVVTVSLLEKDIMDTGYNRCGYIDGVAQQFDNLVTCEKPMIGRFVQVKGTGCFHLYEVEVYGN